MSDSPDILKNHADPELERALPSFDSQKFLFILRKSIPVVILIIAAGIITSIMIVRYTKPEFQSSSIIKLDIKSEASILGLSNMGEAQNFNNISSEIELLRSRLFFNKVLDEVDIDVSMYTIGNILNDEKYPFSPFRIEYRIHNGYFYDKPFYIDVLENNQYRLKYSKGNSDFEDVYSFGETITNDDFRLRVSKTVGYGGDIQGEDFFFIFNSRNSLIDYLSRNLTVEPLNLNANTIQISFKDYNRNKARDLVNAIDTIYLNYTREEKNKANNQKIKFLNERLLDTEDRLTEFEDYFESFTIQNKTTNLDENISSTIHHLNSIDSQQFNIQVRLSRLKEIEKNLNDGDSIELSFTDLRLIPAYLREDINILNQLMTERDILLGSYNQNTQAFQKKDSEIKLILNRIISGLEQYIDGLEQQVKVLSNRKRQLENEFVGLPSKNTEFTKSQRYYTLYEEFYLSLMQRKAEFQLALAGTVTDFKILSPASIPSKPLSPDKWTIYAFGFIGSLVFSFFYVGLVYLANNRITSLRELERSTSIPILGSVPFYTEEKMPVSKLINKGRLNVNEGKVSFE
jgi:tyrosine-protein kinase Etk/Wzc